MASKELNEADVDVGLRVVVLERRHQVLLVDQLDEHCVAGTAVLQPNLEPVRAASPTVCLTPTCAVQSTHFPGWGSTKPPSGRLLGAESRARFGDATVAAVK